MLHTLKKREEILHFCITGATATVILYGIYYLLLYCGFSVDFSFTAGFVASLVCNFILTNHYTFHTRIDFNNGWRFLFCQGINFLLQYILLKFFIFLGISEKIALIPVWAVILPVNFRLLRTLLRSERFRLHLHKLHLHKF